MPVSLAQAALNTQDDLDMQVIDEFRKGSAILDALTFHDAVNPSGGGSTLTYGYHRLITQPTADFRAINSEYTPTEVTKQRFTVDLAVLGGSFQIDRVLAGIARGAEVTLQMQQKIKATTTKFQDAVINGDTAVDTAGFDGLNKALAGSSTEMQANGADWTVISQGDDSSFKALDMLDEFLTLLDGAPTMILGNRFGLARVRGIARRAGMYTQNPVADLLGVGGRPIIRESYGNVLLVDPGDKAGTNLPIIPVYDPDNAAWTITETGSPTGGTYTLKVTTHATDPLTDDTEETATIAHGAAGSVVQAAIQALSNVGAGNATVTGSGPYVVTFAGALAKVDVGVALGANSLTGGTAPTVTTVESANVGGLTDLYAVRFDLDGFHAVSAAGSQLVNTWMPDFVHAGAVKTGEVELGPVAVALKATKAAAVLRGIRVR